jgi:hypothetical protein
MWETNREEKKGEERKIHAEYCGCHTLILYADMNMFHKCETNEEKAKSKYFLQFQHLRQKATSLPLNVSHDLLTNIPSLKRWYQVHYVRKVRVKNIKNVSRLEFPDGLKWHKR